MRARMGGASLGLMSVLLAVSGCAAGNHTVADAFPRAGAGPWSLEDDIWSGSFAEAAPALGDDAAAWEARTPTRVWLATYRLESAAGRKLTVRTFAFDSPNAARAAFQHFRPPDATDFYAGDEGCWTDIGVLFVWGRLVFDIFGTGASWQNEVQAAVLAGHIQNQMHPGLPDAPQ